MQMVIYMQYVIWYLPDDGYLLDMRRLCRVFLKHVGLRCVRHVRCENHAVSLKSSLFNIMCTISCKFPVLIVSLGIQNHTHDSTKMGKFSNDIVCTRALFVGFNGSQLAKMKKSIPDMSLPQNL